MLKPMFGHRPKPRKFNMPTRYYDPEEEERQGSKVIAYALALALVVYIISVL